ncbi:unnamed protein product, partial [Rotaria magnacalcarata]
MIDSDIQRRAINLSRRNDLI